MGTYQGVIKGDTRNIYINRGAVNSVAAEELHLSYQKMYIASNRVSLNSNFHVKSHKMGV